MSETFLIKLEPKASNFIKKSLWHKCFPVNFAKFIRTTFLQNTSGTASVLVLSVCHYLDFVYSVCNFQSMKSPVELNRLFSKIYCYIT